MKFGIQEKTVTILGESVHLRSMNGGDNAVRVVELMQRSGSEPATVMELGGILAFECVQADGQPAFKSVEEARQRCSMGFLKDIIRPALEVSGLGEDADELAKNSEAGQ